MGGEAERLKAGRIEVVLERRTNQRRGGADAIEDAAVAGMNDGCEKAFSKPELGSNDELLQTYQSFQC
jgi:hypothetical protein